MKRLFIVVGSLILAVSSAHTQTYYNMSQTGVALQALVNTIDSTDKATRTYVTQFTEGMRDTAKAAWDSAGVHRGNLTSVIADLQKRADSLTTHRTNLASLIAQMLLKADTTGNATRAYALALTKAMRDSVHGAVDTNVVLRQNIAAIIAALGSAGISREELQDSLTALQARSMGTDGAVGYLAQFYGVDSLGKGPKVTGAQTDTAAMKVDVRNAILLMTEAFRDSGATAMLKTTARSFGYGGWADTMYTTDTLKVSPRAYPSREIAGISYDASRGLYVKVIVESVDSLNQTAGAVLVDSCTSIYQKVSKSSVCAGGEWTIAEGKFLRMVVVTAGTPPNKGKSFTLDAWATEP